MELEQIIQKIAEIRTRKNVELRIYANEHPQRTVTLEEVADAVDEVLQEVTQTLMDALSDEDRDEQAERERWYGGYAEVVADSYPLSHTPTTASWYAGAPE